MCGGVGVCLCSSLWSKKLMISIFPNHSKHCFWDRVSYQPQSKHQGFSHLWTYSARVTGSKHPYLVSYMDAREWTQDFTLVSQVLQLSQQVLYWLCPLPAHIFWSLKVLSDFLGLNFLLCCSWVWAFSCVLRSESVEDFEIGGKSCLVVLSLRRG